MGDNMHDTTIEHDEKHFGKLAELIAKHSLALMHDAKAEGVCSRCLMRMLSANSMMQVANLSGVLGSEQALSLIAEYVFEDACDMVDVILEHGASEINIVTGMVRDTRKHKQH